MQILRILGKMWRQLAQRPGQTLRIFWLPALLAIVFTAIFPFMVAATSFLGMAVSTSAFILITAVVKISLFSWAAVNFHRHILLGEVSGATALSEPRKTAEYALGLFIVTAICMGVFVVLRFTLGSMASGSTAPDRAALVIYWVPLVVSVATALRLAAPLPALAVGRSYFQGLVAQQVHRLLFAGLVVIVILAIMLEDLLFALLAPPILAQIGEANTSLTVTILLIALTIVQIIGAAFAISLLSAAYRTLDDQADA